MSFKKQIPDLVERVEHQLERWLPDPTVEPRTLHGAMRYSVLGGQADTPHAGLRYRPVSRN